MFLLALTLAPARVCAQTLVPHLRPETPGLRSLTTRAAERSPIVRALIDRLDQSSVIVYLRHRVFGPVAVDGQIGLLSASSTHRFLVIELACDRSELTQMATLAHELHHALEIAGEPSVVDIPSLMRFYTRVGVGVATDGRHENVRNAGRRRYRRPRPPRVARVIDKECTWILRSSLAASVRSSGKCRASA